MSMIEMSCYGSDAILTNTPNIYTGSNVDKVKFKFDSDWNAFTTKTAVFYLNAKETALQILDTDNIATIPPEMLAKAGKLSVGVVGTNTNGDFKSSKILTYIIGKGAVNDDLQTTACTPDIWLQLLSIVEKNKQICDDMKLEVDESQMTNKANKDLSNVTNAVLGNKGIARVVTGSYVGTGKYGSSNKNVISLNFAPKLVIIGSEYIMYYPKTSITLNGNNLTVTWNNNSVKWYGQSADAQFNSTVTYHYLVIG